MTDQRAPSETWRRCARCGFATALMSPEQFADHECISHRADPEAPTLIPLFHTCGAIVLYSRVPVVSGQRAPHWRDLVLADGKTPMWTPTRGALMNRRNPPDPGCQNCGGTVGRNLRTQPVSN